MRKVAARFRWVYRNSLFLAFLRLFVLSFASRVAIGPVACNEERPPAGRPPISIATSLASAKFRSSTLQTRQAESLAIAPSVVSSIFLRRQDSAESKPAESSSEATGKGNS